ncbi:MAG: hypothetical protein M1818_004115 [Claussenomyces sp. TS43310]|nr:MAG: hypothetical protein M1818_004115 [Claussenomyces sp. TS43310]
MASDADASDFKSTSVLNRRGFRRSSSMRNNSVGNACTSDKLLGPTESLAGINSAATVHDTVLLSPLQKVSKSMKLPFTGSMLPKKDIEGLQHDSRGLPSGIAHLGLEVRKGIMSTPPLGRMETAASTLSRVGHIGKPTRPSTRHIPGSYKSEDGSESSDESGTFDMLSSISPNVPAELPFPPTTISSAACDTKGLPSHAMIVPQNLFPGTWESYQNVPGTATAVPFYTSQNTNTIFSKIHPELANTSRKFRETLMASNQLQNKSTFNNDAVGLSASSTSASMGSQMLLTASADRDKMIISELGALRRLPSNYPISQASWSAAVSEPARNVTKSCDKDSHMPDPSRGPTFWKNLPCRQEAVKKPAGISSHEAFAPLLHQQMEAAKREEIGAVLSHDPSPKIDERLLQSSLDNGAPHRIDQGTRDVYVSLAGRRQHSEPNSARAPITAQYHKKLHDPGQVQSGTLRVPQQRSFSIDHDNFPSATSSESRYKQIAKSSSSSSSNDTPNNNCPVISEDHSRSLDALNKLETVPLNTADEKTAEDYHGGFDRTSRSKPPYDWDPFLRASGYRALPKHQPPAHTLDPFSSISQDAFVDQDSTQNSTTNNAQGRPFDALVSMARNKLRSVSSIGSLKPSHSADRLHDLVSRGQRQSSRFTALPPRSHDGSRPYSSPLRSNTMPSEHTGETSMNDSVKASTAMKFENKSQDPQISEVFKVIDDLEYLLSEALLVAGEASKRDDTAQIPVPPQNHKDTFLDRKYRTVASRLASGPPDVGRGHGSAPISSSLDTSDSEASAADNSRLLNLVLRGYHSSSGGDTDEPEEISHDQLSSTTQLVMSGMNQIASPSVIVATSVHQNATKVSEMHSAVAQPKNLEVSAIGMPLGEGSVAELPDARDLLIHHKDDTFYERSYGEQRNQSKFNTEITKLPRHSGISRRRPGSKVLENEDDPYVIGARRRKLILPKQRDIREYNQLFHQLPIQGRISSAVLNGRISPDDISCRDAGLTVVDMMPGLAVPDPHSIRSLQSLDGPHGSSVSTEVDFATSQGIPVRKNPTTRGASRPEQYEMEDLAGDDSLPKRHISGHRLQRPHELIKLRGLSHVSIDGIKGFSLSRSHRRKPIARDWSPFRKRYVAAIACVSTAMIGILVGIYAGEVPSIQYYIADFHHYAILGNVFFFIGLSIPVFVFWPLPLLHGRKPYILGAMTIAMPLLFPQAIMVGVQRSPYVPRYRVGLLLPRAFMGLALGFAQMNFLSILTDLFGASLQSGNPHQEVVDEYDVRRHGGGLGVWLGIWTWSYVGSIGIGFLIGSSIISNLSPDWGLYISIILIALVLLLNVITPEVRRSAYRRSVTEVRTPTDISRRVARGEVMMHRLQTGPKWWGEEFHQGVMLSLDMLRQPGFLVMVFYVAWIYGQVVLIIVLLGSLMSKRYRYKSPIVGVTTLAIPIGALLAVPFQKASIFSRARHHPQRTDSMTFEKRVTWSSHLIRRSIFTLVLPFADLAYTLASDGPPTPYILPILFAGLIAFLSNLAIAECNGLIMENFDTSDLQPGMTGRPRGASGERTKHKRTNYSSFPRVSSAFALVQGFGFLIAAGATGVGGVAERRLGQRAATGVMAGILLLLTVMLLAVLFRWKEVQIIPATRAGDMEVWERKRRESVKKLEEEAKLGRGTSWNSTRGLEKEDDPWRPVIIGNPSGKTRRMSILELGHLSRWSEIRRRNRLIDEGGYEGRHPNLAALDSVRDRLKESNLGSFRRKRRDEGRSGEESSVMSEVDLVDPDRGQRARPRDGA